MPSFLPPAPSRWEQENEQIGHRPDTLNYNSTGRLANKYDYSDIEMGGCWLVQDGDLKKKCEMQRVRLSKSAARTSFAVFLSNMLHNDLLHDREVF